MAAGFDPNGAGTRPDYPRSPLKGRLVAVMRLEVPDRGLLLVPQVSRCLRRHDVHELIATTESGGPGGRIGAAFYLGFVEMTVGGVLLTGDELLVAGSSIGRVLGFDETHMPNHMNIVLRTQEARSGRARGFGLDDEVLFRPDYTP